MYYIAEVSFAAERHDGKWVEGNVLMVLSETEAEHGSGFPVPIPSGEAINAKSTGIGSVHGAALPPSRVLYVLNSRSGSKDRPQPEPDGHFEVDSPVYQLGAWHWAGAFNGWDQDTELIPEEIRQNANTYKRLGSIVPSWCPLIGTI